MNLINIPEINRWAKGTWVWNEIRFNTLKEAKFFIDNVQAKPSLFRLITEYEGYDYIAHYDYEGIITSIVEIVPERTPCPTYHYTKSRRVVFANSGHSLVCELPTTELTRFSNGFGLATVTGISDAVNKDKR